MDDEERRRHRLQPFQPDPELPVKTQLAQLLRRFWFDWLMAIVVVAITYPIEDSLQPWKRVFRLDDPDIGFPWKEDQIPRQWMPVFQLVAPAVIIFSISLFIRPHLFDLHNALLGLFASAAMSGLVTDLLKSSIGRLRPDFLSRCMVDPRYLNGTIPLGPGAYVDESVCLNKSSGALLNGRQSFPSGHTSGAFVGMTYTSLYLLAHLPTLLPFHRVSLHLPNLFLGFLPLSLAVWVGITRVQDYRHNPSDVLGGMIVGMTFAGVGWWAFGRRGAKAWRISLNDYGDREGRAYHPQGYERIGGDPAAIVTSP